MWNWVLAAVGGVLLVGVAFVGFVFVGLRTQSKPILTAIRKVNRVLWNRAVLKTAGQPGSSAAVIHHVGRKSGQHYRTPIGVVDTDEGFAVVLPYGTSPDWLKNVRAVGAAVLVHNGDSIRVEDPRVVPMAEAAGYLPDKERRAARRFGIDQCLLLRRSDSDYPTVGRP